MCPVSTSGSHLEVPAVDTEEAVELAVGSRNNGPNLVFDQPEETKMLTVAAVSHLASAAGDWQSVSSQLRVEQEK